MKETNSAKLTKTASSANYSIRDDDSSKMTIEANFSFDGKGGITDIGGGRASDANGLTLATFSRNQSMSGVSIQFYSDAVDKMQEVIAEVGNFIDAASEEGGAA